MFCKNCGNSMDPNAAICVKCGCPVKNDAVVETKPTPSALTTAAKVFMIISTVYMAIFTFCIGLAWCLPMTISYSNKRKRGERVGTGFKICTLLFVSMIAGILMLCEEN